MFWVYVRTPISYIYSLLGSKMVYLLMWDIWISNTLTTHNPLKGVIVVFFFFLFFFLNTLKKICALYQKKVLIEDYQMGFYGREWKRKKKEQYTAKPEDN